MNGNAKLKWKEENNVGFRETEKESKGRYEMTKRNKTTRKEKRGGENESPDLIRKLCKFEQEN